VNAEKTATATMGTQVIPHRQLTLAMEVMKSEEISQLGRIEQTIQNVQI
jgi:hypothetical protein